MMDLFLEHLIVFQFCCCAGWVLEVVYRSLAEKRFINPGFLLGPWLPVYGFGGFFVYLLCKTSLASFDSVHGFAAFFLLSCVIMTLLEAAAGLILLYKFKIRLWNYSNLFGNFKGVVCPLFSALWGVVCIFFRLLIFPTLVKLAQSVSDYSAVPFFSGIILGIFAVDLCYSFDLARKMREYASLKKTVIHTERLKAEIYRQAERIRKLPKFHYFKGRKMLRQHIDKFLSDKFGK